MNFTSKEKRIQKDGQERTKQADYARYIKSGQTVKTWSATHRPDYSARPTGKDKTVS